ncbi:MAG: DUF4294 domain-containing protein [Bacteroidales bacterium]|nr:DUF4294 domain-containing protein [Bacteroidales bacterium]MBR6273203.1 DUF4294 domain-containing protein [Bacteroidales bacterium]
MKKFLLAIVLLMVTSTGFSQVILKRNGQTRNIVLHKNETPAAIPNSEKPLNVVYAQVNGRDTMLIVYLPEVDIDLMGRYYEIAETRQGRRLVNNVRKVYPYAKTAALKLQEFDSLLLTVDSERERRRMMKEAEDQLSEEYTEELKHLNFSQGAILIRLIDRETGNTSYQLVQELRGKVRAFFYQGFARLWGYNLKSEFDPKHDKEDEQIDIIATLLERGQI